MKIDPKFCYYFASTTTKKTRTEKSILMHATKAELLQEDIFFLAHLFSRDVLVMKKLEIEKLSPFLLYQF